MSNISNQNLTAKAYPAKKFFVNMLTRDIELPDAILDLLDNCVDGIIRTENIKDIFLENETPYKGYYANIEMNHEYFRIEDNCGGIPLNVAQNYAFMMGRDKAYDEDLPTVGMYGIGMKRALFKMGKHSTILSNTEDNTFQVVINQTWLESESDWVIPITPFEKDSSSKYGTEIKISKLYPTISEWFNNATFISQFKETVAQNFSYIISKGFTITVNGVKVDSAPLTLLFDKSVGIVPYVYSADIGNVNILLQVGISKGMLSEDEIEKELVSRHTKEDSGWTIVCNDRVVMYKDKTMRTGWGEAGVPSFHSQFNGINGIVFFKSNSLEELPLNTTKRGIEHSSKLYLEVKNHMRTGTKLFTDYTNNWKRHRDEEKQLRRNIVALDAKELTTAIEPLKWNTISQKEDRVERVFKPSLPKPNPKVTHVQIAFKRELEEIQKVSQYLFDTTDKSASTVGNECFEIILRGIEE